MNKNLPWVEKYRPSNLEDLVSHESIINTIGKFIKKNQLPHLLFYGPPGTGKTSTILACARLLYTPKQFSSMVLELNASDDRGIGIVRGQILTFASTKTIFTSGFKLIILDEADAMTMDAQNALRRSDLEHKKANRLDMIRNFVQEHNVQNFYVSAKSGERVVSSILELIYKHLGIKMPPQRNAHTSCPKISPTDVAVLNQKHQKFKKKQSGDKTMSRLQSPVCILQ